MKNYEDLVDFLLSFGFKRIDMTIDGDEIFKKDKLVFAVKELKKGVKK